MHITERREGGERIKPNADACCMIEGWDLKHCWKRARAQICIQYYFISLFLTDLVNNIFSHCNIQKVRIDFLFCNQKV